MSSPDARYTTPKLLGAALAFLGGATVVTWYLNSLELVTVPANWVDMQYNTAVGFVLTGLAMVAHCVGRRRIAFACGAVAAGIGSVALAEVVLGRQLHLLDGLLGTGPLRLGMSPNTALCFSLTGCLLVIGALPTTQRNRRWREVTSAVMASLIAAAGFVGLLNFVLVDPTDNEWARVTHMELHSALAFVGLGVAFFVMIDHFRRDSVRGRLPAWSPWAAGIGVGALIVAVWVGLTSSEQRLRAMSTTKTHEAAVTHANQLMQSQLKALERLSRLAARDLESGSDGLADDVTIFTDGLPGMQGLVLLDASRDVVLTSGALAGEEDWPVELTADDAVTRAVERCHRERTTSVTEPITVGPLSGALVVCQPVMDDGEILGALVVHHDTEELFDAVFADGVGRTFDVEIFDENDQPFYRSYDAYTTPPRHVSSRTHHAALATGQVAFADRIWTIRGAVGPAWTAGGPSTGSTLILWVGLFLAVSIAFAVRKSELLRERAASLEDAKATIENGVVDLRQANRELEERRANLEASEERLRRTALEKRRVLDSLSAFIVGVDGEGVVTEWNFVSSELFGMSSGDVLGQQFETLGLPWDADAVLDAVSECRATGERVRRDNFTVTSGEHEGEARVVSFTVNPTIEDGDRRGFAIIGSDVTERQMLAMQLHNSQKLESVGTLAAGIAHEINTPMQFVSDNVRFLSQSTDPIIELLRVQPQLVSACEDAGVDETVLGKVRELLGQVDVEFVAEEMPMAIGETLEGVDRVTTIVKAMKDFSHPGDTGVAAADINEAIETTLQVARNEYKYHVDIVKDLGDLPPVECWIGDLNQVFLNLLVNGTHAIRDRIGDQTGDRGTIHISTRHDGDFVEMRFRDSGTGIPEEARAHIFEQFYTTKEIGKGTGLGLAIARAVVVEKHGGEIRFETELGEGTTFIVRVPVHHVPAEVEHDVDPVR